MKSIFTLLIVLGISAIAFAQSDVTVAYAGASVVNGRYIQAGTVNGIPRYVLNNNGFVFHLYKDPVYMGGTYWAIATSLDSTGNTTDWMYAYNDAGNPTDPTDGVWDTLAGVPDSLGAAPAPQLTFNLAPVMSPQTFIIDENSANGTVIGTVQALDPDTADVLTFSEAYGDPNNAFTISANGDILVDDASLYNYEDRQFLTVAVQVTDNGTVPLSTITSIRVDLNDVNETPTASPQVFSIDENSPANTKVGNFIVSDVDAGSSHTYSITAGNASGAFKIDANTGTISVNDPLQLDHEDQAIRVIQVTATDNGGLSVATGVTINVNDINEVPAIPVVSFTIAENAAPDASIGNVTNIDPDAGQVVTYAIANVLPGEPFTINTSTGELKVNNPDALDFETAPNMQVIVEATDNGSPVLSSQSSITVMVTDANDAPTVTDVTIPGTEDMSLAFTANFFTAGFIDQDGDAMISVELVSLPKHGQLIMDGTTPLVVGDVVDAADWTRVSYVPELNFNGTDEFSWLAADAQVTSVFPAKAYLELAPVNDPPVKIGTIADISVQEDAPVVVGHALLTDVFTDVENGGNLDYRVLENTNTDLVHVVIDADHRLNLVFLKDANGQATITVRASDNSSFFQTEQFTVNVGPVQDLPVEFICNTPFNEVLTAELSTLTFDWTPSLDVDGDPLTYTLFLSGDDGSSQTFTGLTTSEMNLNGVGVLNVGVTYTWYVEVTDGFGTTTSNNSLGFKVTDFYTGVEDIMAGETKDLNVKSFPNPFTTSVTISYELPTDAQVTLKVYNTIGGEMATIVSEKQYAGNHQFVWNGKDNQGISVPTGYYIYQITVDDGVSIVDKSWKMLKF